MAGVPNYKRRRDMAGTVVAVGIAALVGAVVGGSSTGLAVVGVANSDSE
jgi:hypothetical protein